MPISDLLPPDWTPRSIGAHEAAGLGKKLIELFIAGPSQSSATALGSSYAGGFVGRRISEAASALLGGNAVSGALGELSTGLAGAAGDNPIAQFAASFATRFAVDYATSKTTQFALKKVDQTQWFQNLTPNQQQFWNSAMAGAFAGTLGRQLAPINQAFATNVQSQAYTSTAPDVTTRAKENFVNAASYLASNAPTVAGQAAAGFTSAYALTPSQARQAYYQKAATQYVISGGVAAFNAARPPGQQFQGLGPARAENSPSLLSLFSRVESVSTVPKVRRK